MFEVTVDASQLNELIKKLDPEQVERRARTAMDESLEYLQHEIVTKASSNTGAFRASVFGEIRGRSLSEMRGIVASPLAYAVVIEYGRKPGKKMPPIGPIELWARRVLGESGLGFVIARAIGRRGLPAHHLFRNAAEKGGATVQRIWLRHFSTWGS